MANDINRNIKIYINSTEAGKSIEGLKEKIRQLESELSKLDKENPTDAARASRLKSALQTAEKNLSTYRRSVEETERVLKNLSGATYKELLAVKRKINTELQKTTRGTEEYRLKLEQLKRVSQEVKVAQAEMSTELTAQRSVWSRANDWINNWMGTIGMAVAAVTGFTISINKLRELQNRREESKADVKALTGLDDESIEWLNKKAIELSTTMNQSGIRIRQSADEILEAYKLVGSAKPELLENKEALAAVTEQTLILASASGMKLKDAVEGATLALNQYGAGADQAQRYVNVLAAGSKFGAASVESQTAAIRNAGVAAASANVSIEETVGLIETLAEKGIKDEVAGTGLKKFFLTLQTGADETNPKIVGLEKAIRNLADQQLAAADIKKMFGEEGFNVASVLINETDKIKKYTEAVSDTSVAIEQAGIKSETAAAKLDQAKNRMLEMGNELMEKINPAITAQLGHMVNWVKYLILLAEWIGKNTGLIATLTATVVAYTTAVKAAQLWQSKWVQGELRAAIATKASIASTKLLAAAHLLLTGRIRLAVVAMRSLLATLSINPIVAAGVALTALAGVIYKLATRTTEAKETMKAFLAASINEQAELDKLYTSLKRSGEGTAQRTQLINEFNNRFGEYLPNLLTEQATIEDIRKAYEQTAKAMRERLAVKTLADKTEELETASLERKAEELNDVRRELSVLPESMVKEAISDIVKQTERGLNAGYQLEDVWTAVVKNIRKSYFGDDSNALPKRFANQLKDYVKEVYATAEKIKSVKQELSPFLPDQQPDAQVYAEATVTGSKKSSTSKAAEAAEEDKDIYKAKLDALDAYLTEERTRIQQAYLEKQINTLQYNAAISALEQEGLMKKMDIYALDKEKQMEALDLLQKYRIKIMQESLKLEQENAKKIRKIQEQTEKQRINSLNGSLQAIVKKNMEIETAEYKQEMEHRKRMISLIEGFSTEMGTMVGNALSGNSDLVKSSLASIINMALDALKLQCEIAVAGATMQSLATADSVLTFGASGLARAAVLTGLIEGAFAAVKAVVNNLVGGIGSGISGYDDATTAEEKQTGRREATGYYTGGYTGKGHASQVAGVVHANEYVVPSFVLAQPAALNYVEALEAMRSQTTRVNPLPKQGFAQGGYTSPASGSAATARSEIDQTMVRTLLEIQSALDDMRRTPMRSYVVLSELQKKQETLLKSRRIGGKK